MIEILKLIANLPDINSPEDEDAYIKQWEAVGLDLQAWQNVLVSKTWSGLNHSKMGFGELLAIMIELLPSDENFLKLLQKKLEIATKVTDVNDYAFAAFFNLNSAVYVQLDKSNPDFKKPAPADERKKTLLVVRELQRLEALKKACRELMQNVLVNLDKAFQKYANLYPLYVSANSTFEEAFDKIHDDLLAGRLALVDSSPEVKQIRKFMALKDIYCTLISKEYPARRATILKAKLDEYKTLFDGEIDSRGLMVAGSIAHHTFFYFSPASKFYVLCDDIIRKNPEHAQVIDPAPKP